MVQKFMVEKSGVEKFMVEKSGVERFRVESWSWKVRGWDVLQPLELLVCFWKSNAFVSYSKFFWTLRQNFIHKFWQIWVLLSNLNWSYFKKIHKSNFFAMRALYLILVLLVIFSGLWISDSKPRSARIIMNFSQNVSKCRACVTNFRTSHLAPGHTVWFRDFFCQIFTFGGSSLNQWNLKSIKLII